jgi:quinol monooxygenase YgiN
MRARQFAVVAAASLMSFLTGLAFTGQLQMPAVRIAELEIDPAQLPRYLAIAKEEMETSVRVEPGVLAIYAVAEKDHPNRLRFFEIYANEDGYKSHIQSPHFKAYFTSTQSMIASRKLIDVIPVQLSAKSK